jgi:release factor glutamine methyltransferase
MKLSELKQQIDAQLATIIETPSQIVLERNMLLEHFLNIPLEILYRDPDSPIEKGIEYQQLSQALLQRIEKRFPIQYLLGNAMFYGQRFTVTPAVLIPRPETELLVENVISFCQSHPVETILDLGTGSGCIAITLKKQLPHVAITASDCSVEALTIAQENAAQHQTLIRFLHGSWFEPVAQESFDLIVSNPPYIDEAEKPSLTPEVLHEPQKALFSKENPIEAYQKLIRQCNIHLNPAGSFWFEMGIGQAAQLSDFAEELDFKTTCFKDYNNLDRILAGIRLLDPSLGSF